MDATVRVLVVTVVHTPLDARIHHRQIRALREAGAAVTYVAPWRDADGDRSQVVPGTVVVDVPRARGRHRIRAWLAARRAVRQLGPVHDVVLVHDPELLLALVGLRRRPPLIWDVHEDTAAALIDKPWLPRAIRPMVRFAVKSVERAAERRHHLILAERGYGERFADRHAFVPNVPPLRDPAPRRPSDRRVVYVGRIARGRGALEMIALAGRLHDRMAFEFIGPVDADVEPQLREAVDRGELSWTGFLPNETALQRLEGAMAGLCLVRDEPNHSVSLQTKVLEYASCRVPVLATDLTVTGPFVRERGIGLAVPVGDLDAASDCLVRLQEQPQLRQELGDRGYELIAEELNWGRFGPAFARYVVSIARGEAVVPTLLLDAG